MTKQQYFIAEYSKDGKFLGVVSGLGSNRLTWDYSAKSLRTAQRWAKLCRQDSPNSVFKIE